MCSNLSLNVCLIFFNVLLSIVLGQFFFELLFTLGFLCQEFSSHVQVVVTKIACYKGSFNVELVGFIQQQRFFLSHSPVFPILRSFRPLVVSFFIVVLTTNGGVLVFIANWPTSLFALYCKAVFGVCTFPGSFFLRPSLRLLFLTTSSGFRHD